MATRWLSPIGIARVVIAALLTASLAGCGPDIPSSQADISEVKMAQADTPSPTETMVTPSPTPTLAAAEATSIPTPTPVATVPPAITRSLSDVYANVDWFEGVITVTANKGAASSASMTLRQWFRKPNPMKLEVISSTAGLAPAGSTFVYDGQTLTLYDPNQNQVIEIQSKPQLVTFLNLPQQRLFPHLQLFQAQQFLSGLSKEASVALDGIGTVAGRRAFIVNVTPKNQTGKFKTVKLWLDEQTKVPLKVEAIRENGSVLLDIEYQQFDPTTEVSPAEFAFTPPANATVLSPTPEDVAKLASFQSTTLQEAQANAGFPILAPGSLPAGMSLQMVGISSFDGNNVVAMFYGDTPDDISTVLIEKPTGWQPPVLRGAEFVNMDGTNAEVYQSQGMVVIDWARGDTALTLASTMPRDQAIETARSIQ